MLKKTSCLLFLLAVSQAAKIEEIYGDWVQAAFYPVSGYIPVCIRFLFNKATEDMQCTYSDGSKANSVQMSMITEPGALYAQSGIPVTIVDTYEEVMPVLNLTCKCGDKEVRDAVVTRMVNEDTFVMYTNKSPEGSSEENSAYLFTRGPVSSEKLYGLMTSIEDLKNRRGAMMCATENYGGFKKN